MMWGCVDASSSTAEYNMKKGYSLLIFVGGEKEQLMTKPNEHKIYLKSRKGFVKLALKHGADLVPMYAYGENECYTISNFASGFRIWLQHKFQIGLPIMYGLWGTLMPYRVKMVIEVITEGLLLL